MLSLDSRSLAGTFPIFLNLVMASAKKTLKAEKKFTKLCRVTILLDEKRQGHVAICPSLIECVIKQNGHLVKLRELTLLP